MCSLVVGIWDHTCMTLLLTTILYSPALLRCTYTNSPLLNENDILPQWYVSIPSWACHLLLPEGLSPDMWSYYTRGLLPSPENFSTLTWVQWGPSEGVNRFSQCWVLHYSLGKSQGLREDHRKVKDYGRIICKRQMIHHSLLSFPTECPGLTASLGAEVN